MNPHLKKLLALIPALFFVALVLGMPKTASAIGSTRYWVGNSGTWDTSSTTHWSDMSGGTGGFSVPTSADNCVFDAASFSGVGTVTISGTVECLAMTWTSIASPPVLSIPAGQQLNVYGSLNLSGSVAGMTVNGPGFILLRAPSSAGIQTITSGNLVNIATGMLVFDGGSYQLSSNLIANTLYLVSGTFDANDFDLTLSTFSSATSNPRTLNMGSGTWTLNAVSSLWDISASTSMTLNPEASTLTFNATDGSQKDFYGGGLSYQSVHFNGRNIVIHNSNYYNDTFAVNNAGLPDALFVQNGTTQTVANFTTNGSAGNLAVIAAYTGGGGCVPFTLSKSSGTVAVDYMNISCSAATGGAAWYAGTHSLDGGGNTGWIFADPVDRYWIGGTGTWDGSDTSHWSYESGGSSGAAVPSSIDNVFFDANSFSGSGQTVTRSGTDASVRDMTWTTTDAPTLDLGGVGWHLNIYGSMTLATGMTVTGSGGDAILMYASSGTYTITSNAVTLPVALYIVGGADYVLQDNLSGKDLVLYSGSLDANDFDVSVDGFVATGTVTRALNMGNGAWFLNGTSGSVWNITDPTSLTFAAEGSTIDIGDTGGSAKSFEGGALTYHNLAVSGRNVLIDNSNTFDTLSVNNAGLADGLFTQSSSIQTVSNFTTNASPGNFSIFRSSIPGSPATVSKSSGTISVDWMIFYDSTAAGGATWYAGANSGDASNNSGWIFTSPPAPVASPVAGTYNGTQNVTLTSPGASNIWYTTDGTDPDCTINGFLYSGAITVSSSETVKAIGCFGSGTNPTAVGSFAYVIHQSSGGSGGGGGGGFFTGFTPSPTPTPMGTPTPFPQVPTRGDPANLPRLGLHEGDVVGDTDPNDPDIFIVNIWGYKRLFLNPVIYSFYGHLSALKSLKHITPPDRDSLPTSGLFRNCETRDPKVYALEVTGEDTGVLHWVNISGEQAVAQDPDFFKKDFCINNREFNWYTLSPTPYTALWQLPIYHR